MARSEQVNRGARVQLGPRGGEGTGEFGEPVLLEERDDTTDRENVGHGRRPRGGSCAQVGMGAPLHRDGEEPFPLRARGGRAFLRQGEGGLGFLVVRLRLGEPVQHGRDVRPNRVLKGQDLFGSNLDRTVRVLLERPGIRHDRAVELEQSVDPLPLRDLAERGSSPGDVRRGDHRADAEPCPHLRGRDGLSRGVRVDDGEEGRGLDRSVGGFGRPRRARPSRSRTSKAPIGPRHPLGALRLATSRCRAAVKRAADPVGGGLRASAR